jgi:AcrR family transcriptional regulator
MTYPPYIREKARQLREERGLTIDEIAERLAISRTTIFYWVGDVEIERKPRTGWPGIAQTKGNAAMQEKYRLLREAAYQQGWDEYALLEAEPGFRDFVCMYIGEGYKRSRNVVSIANSDPRVIRLGDHWIRRFAQRKVTYEFQHHADQDPEYLVRFWSFGLSANPAAFRFQRKSNSGQLTGRTWRCKWGVLTVTTNDTMLRARLQAWMDRTFERWLDSVLPGV